MQTVGDDFLLAITGSHTPTLQVDAWYDGQIVRENISVDSGAVTVDGTRAIAGSLSLAAVSEDGSLVPDRWDAPLAPYGSELHVRVGVQTGAGTSEMVSLGWYRIESSEPQEWFASYRLDPADAPEWVCRGMSVQVDAYDRMAVLDDAQFKSPEVPESTASVLNEIKRLAQGLIPVGSFAGISDAAIPAAVVYQTSRVQAIQDLAAVLGRTARVDANGALSLRLSTPSSTSVWTVSINEEDIEDWSRKLDRQDLYNAVVSSGQTPEGVPVQASAVEEDGPLRWDGPFGRVAYAHSSPLITTQAAAQADANTLLERLIRERVAPIQVTCAPNPALEWGDTITLVLPGRTLTGTVRSITFPLPVTSMTMVVMVPRSQLWGA